MEQIQIFDSINNKNVNVFVAQEIAEKCRLDANFAAELVRQIEEQNVEEGSTIEIETVADLQSSSFDGLVEKELWTRKETLKFLKLYQKYGNKYANYKKALWKIISEELASRNILKPPGRCQSKWKNLIRTYKAAKERNNISRFQYYKAVDAVVNGKQLVLSDSESEIESCDENLILTNLAIEKTKSEGAIEKETWSRHDTVLFLKVYQNYKSNIENKMCSKEELWKIISNELFKQGVFKSAEKCSIKFKNLFRTYKKNLERDSNVPRQRFKYFNEVDNLMNNREITLPDNLLSDSPENSDYMDSGELEGYPTNSNIEYEINEESEDDKMDVSNNGLLKWNQNEISKLHWAFNTHKNGFESVENEPKFWQLVSQELKNVGFHRNPEACKIEWDNIQKGNFVARQYDNADFKDIVTAGDSVGNFERENFHNSIKEQDEDASYVKIIIENENGIENTNESNLDSNWTDEEIANLISLCVKYIENNKIKEIDASVWVKISVNVGCTDTRKSAEECKRKWGDLLSTFETCKKLNLHCDNFSVFEKIEEILRKSDEINCQNIDTSRTTNCKCSERRFIEKQRRHTERMQILKRKLDIEERKVKAFEEYVKYIKR